MLVGFKTFHQSLTPLRLKMNKKIDAACKLAGLMAKRDLGDISQEEYDNQFEKLMEEHYA